MSVIDIDSLIEQLLAGTGSFYDDDRVRRRIGDLREVATALRALEKQRDDAYKALEPFAAKAAMYDGHQYLAAETEDGKAIPFPDDEETECLCTVGDLRRARDVVVR